jgi:formate dehydrogenase major subunit
MAEAHPVGFRWVMKARERGAVVINVDPHYARTSALSDIHVPIRSGSDIAFLGGLIRHIIETDSYFREYVVNYTNAATIVSEDFQDTDELDGLFSGFDPETRTYDPHSGQYHRQQDEGQGRQDHAMQRETASALQHETHGVSVDSTVSRDDTLQHPRCV